ncbi:MAG: DNA-3-methyladenine glycosylase 2 family protein [Chloroflexi bacterium]|nr:DNA-3-methyladenine glycosylase 2 family protein [Chloroflexota bacterium]
MSDPTPTPDSSSVLIPALWQPVAQAVLPVVQPYRLDLTVTVLRRTPQNLVDILTADGCYLRALTGAISPLALQVMQPGLDGPLEATLFMAGSGGVAYDENQAHQIFTGVALTLGTRVDLEGFYETASRERELAKFVQAARGVKPPRYPSLWEAICNAVVYQQVSLAAATSTMRRLVAHFSHPVSFADNLLYTFPPPAAVFQADPDVLRTLGLSTNKVRALQEAAATLLAGQLRAEELEELPSPDAMSRLTALRGIGPWTAAVILLRGFGRLDVFPAGDSGARRSIQGLLGSAVDGDAALESLPARLGPWRGMLYYHLLLWRLNQRGVISLAPGES